MQVSGTSLADPAPWGATTIGEALLAPTVIYVEAVLKLIQLAAIKVPPPALTCSIQSIPCAGSWHLQRRCHGGL